MKKITVSFLALFGLIAWAALTSKRDIVSAYSPPPANQYFMLRNAEGMNLKIILPPLELVRPTELRIAGERFVFNPSTGQFTLQTPPSDITVTTTRRTVDGYPRRDYYEVKIRGFVLGGGGLARAIKNLHQFYLTKAYNPPPAGILCVIDNCEAASYQPYEYKMTFAPLSRSVAREYSSWLRSNAGANDPNAIYLGNRGCASVDVQNGTTLCTKITARLTVPGFAPANHILIQAIPVFGGISVEGNVAGTGNISGFVFDDDSPKAIAVGGTVSPGVTGGAGNIQNYVNNSTLLKWDPPGTVGAKIANLYNNALPKAAAVSNNPPHFDGGNIYLNSNNRDLRNSGRSTLSTPPEGKLWKVNGDVILNNVTVNGSGTILVNGNVTINNGLSCASGTRFGIIATGTITINLSGGARRLACGAYVARGGDLVFGGGLNNPDIVYEARGIFVTKGSIRLPSIADDVAFKVKYDSAFAAEPTVIFKELLSIVFSTVS